MTTTDPKTVQTVTIDTAPVSVIAKKCERAFRNANGVRIDSQHMSRIAAEDLKAIKALQKDLEAQRVAITGPLNEALRATNALFAPPADFLKKSETLLKNGLLQWDAEQQRLAEEARRDAESKLAAERDRIQNEARSQHASAAQSAAKLRAEAREALDAGKVDDADALFSQAEQVETTGAEVAAQMDFAAQVMVPAPASEAPRLASGISTRSTWKAEVTDMLALVKFVAENPDWIGLLSANQSALNAAARAQKSALKIGGVKAVPVATMAARSA